MKNYKGGYILISLGLIALSTSYAGTIDYDKVSATRKRVVLTDINVGGTKMPDLTVQPIYGNGQITFSDVYGFDIVVKSDDSVVVSEHQAPEDKGTVLYRHNIQLKDGNSFYNLKLVSTTPTVSLTTMHGSYALKLENHGKLVSSLIYEGKFVSHMIDDSSGDELCNMYDLSTGQTLSFSEPTLNNDTVEEL